MPKKKKKGPTLPPLSGASPPRSPNSERGQGLGNTAQSSQRDVLWQSGLFKAGAVESPVQVEQSAAAALSVSGDDARTISQILDDSLQMTSGLGVTSASAYNAENDWQEQEIEEIIAEVTRSVQEKKPWRQKLDDSVLDHKHNERQDRLERGFHIILPDNRVRVMEDELTYRVRCSLLGVDPQEGEPPPPPRRPDKSKAKNLRMRANPWYLKPKLWYDLKERQKAEAEQEDSNDFPYANVILNLPEDLKNDEAPAQPTPFMKENLDMYKAYLKGNRLPHFLADK